MMVAKKRFLLVGIGVLLVTACLPKNLKYESRDIEKEVKKKRMKLIVEDGFSTELKHRIYFENMVRSYFLTETEIVIVESSYDLLSVVTISNLSHVTVASNGNYNTRLDFLANITTTSVDGEWILSNYPFTHTYVTNVPSEVFMDPSKKDLFLEKVYSGFLSETAFNLVNVIATGWKGSYGYYSAVDGILRRVLGGTPDEKNTTKRTNRRNIPVIGGE